jgi:hypothetical protein
VNSAVSLCKTTKHLWIVGEAFLVEAQANQIPCSTTWNLNKNCHEEEPREILMAFNT